MNQRTQNKLIVLECNIAFINSQRETEKLREITVRVVEEDSNRTPSGDKSEQLPLGPNCSVTDITHFSPCSYSGNEQ
jgi:hypothetical protein